MLDEVHFLQDPYRGSVWEEVLILCPRDVVFVCLSATVSNASELGAWMREVRGPTEVVVETRRPVELRNHLAVTDRSSRQCPPRASVVEGRASQGCARTRPEVQPEEAARRIGTRATREMQAGAIRASPHLGGPSSSRRSAERAMLPAIVFIFSRAACDDAVAQCLRDGVRLIEPEQRAEIRRICEEHTEGISDEELRALDYGPWSAALEAGVAAHHAGMVPAFREAVEECFAVGTAERRLRDRDARSRDQHARENRRDREVDEGPRARPFGSHVRRVRAAHRQGRAKRSGRARPCGGGLVAARARERARTTRDVSGSGAAVVFQAHLQPGREPRQAFSEADA